jgi:hypothetical protein
MAYTWSERTTVDTLAADTEAVANVLPGDAQTELVVSTGGLVKVVPSASLDGGWGAPVTLQTGTPAANLTDVEAYGVPFENRVYVVSVGGGTVRFRVYDQQTWAQVGATVDVYEAFGSPRFPALAVHPFNWRFFEAVWHGAKTILNTSPDRGVTWHENDLVGTVWAADVDDLQYPALWCDRDVLRLVGYMPDDMGNGTGSVMAYQFRADATLEPLGNPVTVGAADEGRPAVIVRPGTQEIVVIVPRRPSGTYTLGRLDLYENVACGGVCDQFVQRFFERKYGMVFPLTSDGLPWWTGLLGWQSTHLPPGLTWIETSSPGDIQRYDAVTWLTGVRTGHIGIADALEDDTWLFAQSNNPYTVGANRGEYNDVGADYTMYGLLRPSGTQLFAGNLPAISQYVSVDGGMTWETDNAEPILT